MPKSEPIMKDAYWRYITNFWCLVSYGAIIYDFVYNHKLGDLLPSILVIYVALLTIFAGVKEFERWFDTRTDRHPGEIFVIGWTIIIFGLFVAKIAFNKMTPIPSEVLSTYIAVLSIMAITQKSKNLKASRRKPRFPSDSPEQL